MKETRLAESSATGHDARSYAGQKILYGKACQQSCSTDYDLAGCGIDAQMSGYCYQNKDQQNITV